MRILGYVSASIIVIVTVVFIVLFNDYVFFDNETNHTAAPLEIGAMVFVLAAIAAAVAALKTRDLARRFWVAALALSAVAAANIVVFDLLHIMMSYETWVHGQPERPEWSMPQR
jgi:hypothetical protein